jgi:hypothetical protein
MATHFGHGREASLGEFRMDKPRVRSAIAADVPAIEEIVNQAYRHFVARIGKPPGPMLEDYAARVSEGWCGCSRKRL